MSDPFLGEIQLYAFQFAPTNWAYCAGQLVPLSQYTALFSLLGINYGGNGQSNFGLPNFQSFAACAVGQGPGLTERILGETFGSESVTLISTEMPQHTHAVNFYAQRDNTKRQVGPSNGSALVSPNNSSIFVQSAPVSGTFPATSVTVNPGNQAHPNQQPYLAMNFCISLQGAFPSRP
ncbi:tail fiber protein [Dyella sp. GSA-30]|uniref:phage tail protein n=1 Tax=Dyella sp. GSA-30 TaxID=2994496 RepID=UPI002491F820|nr:tail fiber protein [Dyella sp. GSA-30]BDU19170.1 microcystin dependent protein [Dyella sp. GSA-30]